VIMSRCRIQSAEPSARSHSCYFSSSCWDWLLKRNLLRL
jgi:hypothetical protein